MRQLAVALAAFWRAIFKLIIAMLIVGLVFLLVSSVLDVAHVLRALFG